MAKLKSGTGTVGKVKETLAATTTATAPDGVEGNLYYDSTKGALMAYATAWSMVSRASAEGGTESTYTGYKVHTFTADAQFTVSGGNLDADVLVVGGGACGGRQHGGGGGAGGVIVHSGYAFSSGTYVVDVGAGGVADTATYSNVNGITGHSGSDTTLGPLYTAKGGGGGAGWTGAAVDGGSGGGGASSYPDGDSTQSTSGVAPTGGSHYGNDGGISTSGKGGGGGGAGGVGEAYDTTRAGDGGVGIQNAFRTGSQVWYGGGGGGSGHGSPHTGGQGGTGGGGAGGDYASPEPGAGRGGDGQSNTGGGGGGGAANDVGHGGGGSGIVVIRYTN